jgi:hypothetical protein
MKRLFVFGCSLTYYTWPTWADLIGQQFDEYYNFGVMGMGNNFIQHTVYEANSIFDFTTDDTVLVMFTNAFRNDSFIIDEDQQLRWQSRGFIYQPNNENLYSDEWKKSFWSAEQSYMQTWLSIKSIQTLLHTKQVNYKLIQGMDFTLHDVANKHFLDPYITQINQMLDVTVPLHDWASSTYSDAEFYTFDSIGRDLHPTIKMHGEYIKHFLPNYYNDQISQAVEELENHINLSDIERNWLNPVFMKYRGRKAGSVANWQYNVTSRVSAEQFKA